MTTMENESVNFLSTMGSNVVTEVRVDIHTTLTFRNISLDGNESLVDNSTAHGREPIYFHQVSCSGFMYLLNKIMVPNYVGTVFLCRFFFIFVLFYFYVCL